MSETDNVSMASNPDQDASTNSATIQRSRSRQNSSTLEGPGQTDYEEAYDKTLKDLKANRLRLTRKQRKNKEKINNIYPKDYPSATDMSSQSGESSGDSDYDKSTRPKRKSSQKGVIVETDKRAERLPKLMGRYETLLRRTSIR